MKNVKKVLVLSMALIFIFGIFGQISLISYANIGNFDIIDGTPVLTVPPASLRDGEIWTGKSVEYNGDGTATITLKAWGSTYVDTSGNARMPLCESDEYVTITDHIGEFHLGALPSGVVAGAGNTAIWRIHQDDIIGPAPAQVSYIIFLDETDWRTGYWYSSGAADVRFYPAEGNPFYWTRKETTFNAFDASVSWNNGNGFNNGMIMDNILGITISLGANRSPAEQTADQSTFPAHWANNAVINGQLYYWHLEWTRGGGPKSHFFTIRDAEGPGTNIRYELVFPNPGGNTSIPGGRTIISEEYFHRSVEPDNPDTHFTWDGAAIISRLDIIAQIQLQEYILPVGYLQINKILEGWFEEDWGVGAETQFSAIMTNQDGYYLTFSVEPGINTFTYTGLVRYRELTTVITFSEDNPAIIAEMPVRETPLPNARIKRYFVEEILDYDTDRIIVTYSFGANGFQVTENETEYVTVTNEFLHGIGYLEIHKFFDGFPADWGVDDDTVFFVRIWDVDHDNYLLFKDYQEPDGSFRHIGDHVFGLDEDFGGTPILEIPISVSNPVTLSNLWTWGRYEVREVRPTVNEPIEAKWAAFWNNIDLDRNSTSGGVWTDGAWIQEVWLEHWEYVEEIIDQNAWNADDDWVWGVAYSDNNGTRKLHFDETIVITMTNRYKYSSGNMTITKELLGYPADWGVNDDTIFHAKVWSVPDVANPEVRHMLIFEEIFRSQIMNGTPRWMNGNLVYRNIGYINSVTGLPVFYYPGDRYIEFIYRIPFSVNSPALLIDLPVGDDYNYIVEEFFDDGVVTDHINITYTFNNGEPIPVGGIKVSGDKNSSLIVNVRNEYAYGTGNLVVVKELAGFPEDWDVYEFTEFFVAVREVGSNEFLKFSPQLNGTMRYIPADKSYVGDTVWLLPFSAANPIIITELNSNLVYEVVELCKDGKCIYDIFAIGFEVEINYDRSAFSEGGNMIATVINRFEHGFGTLRIKKALVNASSPIDDDYWFYAQARDSASTYHLLFVLEDEAENLWRHVGNTSDWDEADGETGIVDRIPFSVSNYATIINLWSGRVYVIEELPGVHTAIHEPLGIMWNGDVLTSLITNHFPPNQAPSFSVTYDGNGNTGGLPPVDDLEYYEGENVVILGRNDLVRTGHVFIGWNTEREGDGEWYQPGDMLTMRDHDVTLYAQWEPWEPIYETFTVMYDGNGNTSGSAPIDNLEYYEGETVVILGRNDLARTGHVFIGWNTEREGNGEWYQPGDMLTMRDHDVTLYAQWEPRGPVPYVFTVTYYGNGNTGGFVPIDALLYYEGETVVIMDRNDLVRAGYRFLGWNKQRHGCYSLRRPGYTFAKANKNVYLYAQWEPVNITAPPVFKVTYDGNGHTGGEPPVDANEYEAGDVVTALNRGDLVKSGHNFLGWNTERDGSGEWRQPSSSFTMPNRDVTLYAQWEQTGGGGPTTVPRITEPPLYTVTYNGNGHTGGSPPVDGRRYRSGETVTVLDSGNLSRSDYRFIGWNTQSDGSGNWYQLSDTFTMPTGNVTLYAGWQPVAPTRWDFFTGEHIWYIRGYENTEMRPDNYITRAEVVMIFYRLLRPEMRVVQSNVTFVDVASDDWFGLGVSVLAYHGIFTGYETGEFRPHAHITRRELAAVVSRFDRLLESDTSPYADVTSDDWAYKYILSATEKGWFVGYGGLFRPEFNLTRAELVTAVNRMLERYIALEDIPDDVFNFPDLDRTHWAYAAFMEAAHSHTFERIDDSINETWTAILGTGLDAPYNQ
ncbi:MAG: InlB B-repeat-containing protein [Oscillospiraceae bacterium]|nr:InlB B-repeat-containing protein [Oscillospiraceae bacterium]